MKEGTRIALDSIRDAADTYVKGRSDLGALSYALKASIAALEGEIEEDLLVELELARNQIEMVSAFNLKGSAIPDDRDALDAALDAASRVVDEAFVLLQADEQ